jgi:hypothetical protein
MSFVGDACAPMSDADRTSHMAMALLNSLDGWLSDLAEIERLTVPGNKRYVLHLMRRMEQGRGALRQIAGLSEE